MTVVYTNTLTVPSGGILPFPAEVPSYPLRIVYFAPATNQATYIYFGEEAGQDGMNNVRLRPGTGVTITTESMSSWRLVGTPGDQLQITAHAVQK